MNMVNVWMMVGVCVDQAGPVKTIVQVVSYSEKSLTTMQNFAYPTHSGAMITRIIHLSHDCLQSVAANHMSCEY